MGAKRVAATRQLEDAGQRQADDRPVADLTARELLDLLASHRNRNRRLVDLSVGELLQLLTSTQ